jgi:hypothetical protein
MEPTENSGPDVLAHGPLTVEELIKELLKFDRNQPVFIALGRNPLKPAGSSKIYCVSQHDDNITCGFGVYLHPEDRLVDSDG